MSRTTTTATASPKVDGQALLECCGYDRRMCGLIIATRPDKEQEQLLGSIKVVHQRKNVAHVVCEIRQALGLEADHALEIRSS